MLAKLRNWWTAGDVRRARAVLAAHYRELAQYHKLGPAEAHQLMRNGMITLADETFGSAIKAQRDIAVARPGEFVPVEAADMPLLTMSWPSATARKGAAEAIKGDFQT